MFDNDQEEYERYREFRESQDDPWGELIMAGIVIAGAVVGIVFGGNYVFGFIDTVTGWHLLPWWQGITASFSNS